jgi:hypothetical protein
LRERKRKKKKRKKYVKYLGDWDRSQENVGRDGQARHMLVARRRN